MPNDEEKAETYTETFDVPIQLKKLIDEVRYGYASADYPDFMFGVGKKDSKTAMLVTAVINLYIESYRKRGWSDASIYSKLKKKFGIEINQESPDFQLKNAYNFRPSDP